MVTLGWFIAAALWWAAYLSSGGSAWAYLVAALLCTLAWATMIVRSFARANRIINGGRK